MNNGFKKFTALVLLKFTLTKMAELGFIMGNSKVKRIIFDSLMGGYILIMLLAVFIRPTDVQMLNISSHMILFLGLCLFSGLISALLNKNKYKTLGEILFESAANKSYSKSKVFYQTTWGWQLISFLVLTLGVGFAMTRFSFTELADEDSLQQVMRLFYGLLNPNWDILPKAIIKMIETIFLAFMATFLAIPIAFVLSFLCAKNIMKHPFAFAVYTFLRTILNITRSVEAFLWAIIFSVWVGIGPFAGMLALMIHSVVSLAKQYSEIVETVNEGPIEGIQATGAGQIQTIGYAIVPQVMLPFISFTIYRWDINIRMATIVGFVGGGGIGSMLQIFQGQGMWPELGAIIFVIAFVVWFMDTTSAYIREALK